MTEGAVRSKRHLWTGGAPLILASKSEARRALLNAAGLDAEILAANIDERALEHRFFADGGSPEDLAPALAEAKALAISASRPEAFCLGADQTLMHGSTVVHKPCDFDAAAQTLAMLSGRTHRLISAFCIARSGKTSYSMPISLSFACGRSTGRRSPDTLTWPGRVFFRASAPIRLKGWA